MTLDARKLLAAVKFGRLYVTDGGMTMVRAITTSGLTARRAQLKLVEQLLADRLIVRGGDGVYRLTLAGRTQLAAAQP